MELLSTLKTFSIQVPGIMQIWVDWLKLKRFDSPQSHLLCLGFRLNLGVVCNYASLSKAI